MTEAERPEQTGIQEIVAEIQNLELAKSLKDYQRRVKLIQRLNIERARFRQREEKP